MSWKRWRPADYQPILDAVASDHGIGIADIIGLSRVAHIVAARKDAANRLRTAGMPRPQIAKALQRDISSIDAYIYPSREKRQRVYAERRQAARIEARAQA